MWGGGLFLPCVVEVCVHTLVCVIDWFITGSPASQHQSILAREGRSNNAANDLLLELLLSFFHSDKWHTFPSGCPCVRQRQLILVGVPNKTNGQSYRLTCECIYCDLSALVSVRIYVRVCVFSSKPDQAVICSLLLTTLTVGGGDWGRSIHIRDCCTAAGVHTICV